MPTPEDVAKWMQEKVTKEQELFQIEAVSEIQEQLGYGNDPCEIGPFDRT